MIKATKISIAFSESHIHQDRKFDEKNPKVFTGEHDCWINAQTYLNDLAHYAPQTGGYHKTDVIVEYADGEVYQGRLDLMHPSCENTDNDLAAHVRRFCRCYGGLFTEDEMPDHLKGGRYQKFLDMYTEDDRAALRKMLDNYEIGVQ